MTVLLEYIYRLLQLAINISIIVIVIKIISYYAGIMLICFQLHIMVKIMLAYTIGVSLLLIKAAIANDG